MTVGVRTFRVFREKCIFMHYVYNVTVTLESIAVMHCSKVAMFSFQIALLNYKYTANLKTKLFQF